MGRRGHERVVGVRGAVLGAAAALTSAAAVRAGHGLDQADTPEFGAGTALAEVGDTLWVGSFRGNRIAILAAPAAAAP